MTIFAGRFPSEGIVCNISRCPQIFSRRNRLLMASKEPTTQHAPHAAAIDATVLERCREEDRDAQQQLYEAFRRRVYRLMVRMVGVQDAADVTQQVFLQVFRKIDQFAGHAKLETWIYRLAVNEALQHLRRQGRRSSQPLTYEPAGREPPHAERREQKETLEMALGRLEPKLRSIFLLREVDELSYREIAEAVDIPEGTVGSRLNRARHELRQHLADLGWET